MDAPSPPPPVPPPDPSIITARPVKFPTLPLASAMLPPSPLSLPSLMRREAALDLGLAVLVLLIVPFGLPLIVAQVTTQGTDLELDSAVLTMRKWFDALLAAGLTAYLILRHHVPAACFGLRRGRWGHQLGWAALGLASIYAYLLASALVILALLALFPPLEKEITQRLEVIKLMPVSSLWLTVLLLVPVAIHEELVFRALLVPYLRRLTGRWWIAILISSLVFGALHFTQGQLGALQVVGVGLVLAIIFVVSRSLLAVVVAHFVFDFMQFQLIRVANLA